MSTLNIETLGKVMETGDIGQMYGGAGKPVSEAGVSRTMHEEGLEASSPDKTITFSDMLRHSVDKVNTDQAQADTAIKDLVAGRTKNIHETMLTIERADASLKLMMQVRNKILDAYREVMRMQV
jgi:flagellar hook-basal body complex protein FliE